MRPPLGSDAPLHRTVSRSSAGGFVLPVVLLCLLALTAAAHGALALARHQGLAGRAGAAAVQARMASESGVRLGIGSLTPRVLDGLRGGERPELAPVSLGPGVTARARVERLRAEWIGVVGAGTAARGALTARRSTAALFWSLEEGARVAGLGAGLRHGGPLALAPGGAVRGSDAVGAPDDWLPEVCAAHVALLDSVLGSEGLPSTAPLHEPSHSGSGGEPPTTRLETVPRLGLLRGTDLEERATVRPAAGRVTPEPRVEGTVCDTDPETNWGAPDDPAGPCGEHAPLVVVSGSLVLEGGRGQGILVVVGDLTLTDDARFVGLALVGGALRVASGSRLQGSARVREEVVVAGRLEASPCGVLRVLRARDELHWPVPAPGGGWIPLN